MACRREDFGSERDSQLHLGSAYAAGDEKNLGSLEVGKYADFIVLDQDLTAIDSQEILDTQVLATYLGGTCVFER